MKIKALFSWLSPKPKRAKQHPLPTPAVQAARQSAQIGQGIAEIKQRVSGNSQPERATAAASAEKPGQQQGGGGSVNLRGDNPVTAQVVPLVPTPPKPPASAQTKAATQAAAASSVKGRIWPAYLIALLLTLMLVLILFAWLSQEAVFAEQLFLLQLPWQPHWAGPWFTDPRPARQVFAKLLTFGLSWPLLLMIITLHYFYWITALHWFGSWCADLSYVTPAARLRHIAYMADVAPLFGLMSSLYAFVQKGSEAQDYIRWLMAGPSLMGMATMALAITFLHLMPQQED
jgi:hypothetical protein